MCDRKKCYNCKEEKSIDDFYSYTDSETKKIIYGTMCKKCFNIKKNKIRKSNPVLRIISHQKRRIRHICKSKNLKKTKNFDEIFGLSTEDFKKYFEGLFYGGITWENYTEKVWEVDHIIPIRDIQTFDDLVRIFHYTNHQPLLLEDHKKKSTDKTPTL